MNVLVAQSCLTLCNEWTVAHQASLFMEFSRQEYWSRYTLPSPGDLPDPGTEPSSPTLQVDSLLSEPLVKPQTIERHLGEGTLLKCRKHIALQGRRGSENANVVSRI